MKSLRGCHGLRPSKLGRYISRAERHGPRRVPAGHRGSREGRAAQGADARTARGRPPFAGAARGSGPAGRPSKLGARALLMAALTCPAAAASDQLAYDVPFFQDATYDAAIPTPESLLGFPAGQRAATHAEIERCYQAWDEASPRTRLLEYARSWEGRPLYILVVTSPQNLARLEDIRAGWARVADPRSTDAATAERLAAELPAVAWLAHSIHGDETSGADAALATAYHLTASLDPEVETLLSDLVVVLDPMMNPDGRDRFLAQIRQHRAAMPNVDDQALLHYGHWPWGRGNHYYFDLNRDWIFGVHPETRGRLAALADWHPLLFVDAHEMGAQDTHLFYPPSEPVNPRLPEHVRRWWPVFGADQARAFDRHGWRYYTGEWAEFWGPYYSDSWNALRGAVGILYEQAGIGEDAVRRPEGTLLTYREAVHHQATSAWANLATLRAHRAELARDFLAARRRAVAADGPFARRTFAVLPGGNATRLRRFAELMELQGIEVYRLTGEQTAGRAKDAFGAERSAVTLPAGTLLVPNRQPEGHLLAAALELDPRLSDELLARERREVLRSGDTLLYDLTAWSVPLLYGLETLELPAELPAGAERWRAETAPPAASGAAEPVAWVIDGTDDGSVAAAARLLERDVEVRVADQALELDGRSFARGSVAVLADDNRAQREGLAAAVAAAAAELGLEAVGVASGLGPGEAPDLGGRHLVRLERPRIGLLGRGETSTTDFGALWLLVDRFLGASHSTLEEPALGEYDHGRYNVLVLPDRGGALPAGAAERLRGWVEAGGTLIAVGDAAAALAAEEPGLSGVRQLPDVLARLPEYRAELAREWEAALGSIEPPAVWAREPAATLASPWPPEEDEDAAELARRDAWQSQFMPQGAILAGRADAEHWLTFGAAETVPIMAADVPVLMTTGDQETAVRFGRAVADGARGEAPQRLGWSFVPAGHRLELRMSGLLWPEAAQRLANAAYLIREAVGDGQVILFAAPPYFRGATWGTARLLANAIVYGPGLGASQPIVP